MSTAFTVSNFAAVATVAIAAISYVIKIWISASQAVSEKRISECQVFATLQDDFLKDHRPDRLKNLIKSSDEFRRAIPSITLWSSVRLQKKIQDVLNVSNKYTHCLIEDEPISESLEYELTVVFGNLQYALQLEVQGYTLQGVMLRWQNWRMRRASKKRGKDDGK